ncbi:MAG TPA: protoglobin domain-containing protein [Pirellulales bacterium]
MQADELFRRYQDLQNYVGWSAADEERVRAAAAIVEPHFSDLVDDFYAEIERHPQAQRVITGGSEQVSRLKGTLVQWLRDLFSSPYDANYVSRRWRVGFRHVLIGLDQVYTNVALSRLRIGLSRELETGWAGTIADLLASKRSLNKLLDLDLAIIELAYQTAFQQRQQGIERLAAIGQMAGGVAHELRNPLNVVKTSVYYLLNARSPSPEKVSEHLRRIERQVGMADGVITALNDFAKLPMPNFQRVSLETHLREIVEFNQLPPEVEVLLEFPADFPDAQADPNQLRIVFSNLIRNARDAMPNGGLLTVRGARNGSGLEISVADTGVGIKPEDLDRIMEPLFTTKARGIGLGLAIARAILEKHNGRLTVASEHGRGTTFVVSLPAG